MGLISHIENLRMKPEHVRRRVAFWYSFGITGFIFVLWLAQFSSFGLGGRSNGIYAEAENSDNKTLLANVHSSMSAQANGVDNPSPSVVQTVTGQSTVGQAAITPLHSLVSSIGSFGTGIKDMFFGAEKIQYSPTVEVGPGRRAN